MTPEEINIGVRVTDNLDLSQHFLQFPFNKFLVTCFRQEYLWDLDTVSDIKHCETGSTCIRRYMNYPSVVVSGDC